MSTEVPSRRWGVVSLLGLLALSASLTGCDGHDERRELEQRRRALVEQRKSLDDSIAKVKQGKDQLTPEEAAQVRDLQRRRQEAGIELDGVDQRLLYLGSS